MLTLTQPAALWLLLALVVLLLVRRIPPRRQQLIGTLHFWAGLDSSKQPAFSHRVRRHQHLLLQASFIVLVVLALAKPQVALSRHDVALVIDTSMSMGATAQGRRRIDEALDQARLIAESLPTGSRIALYLAGPDTTGIGTFSAADATTETWSSDVRLSDGSANLDAAIERARAAEPRPSRIYVISDSTQPSASSGDVEWVHVGTPADNAAITALTVVRGEDNNSISILARVTNFGAVDAVADVVIRHRETLMARQTVSLPAGTSGSAVLQLPAVAGAIQAHLERSDALEADNSRFAVVPAPSAPRALLVGNSSPFLEQALAVLPGIDVATQSSSVAADVVICAGCDRVPTEHPRAGVLLLPSGTPSSTGLASVVLTAGDHPLLADVAAAGELVLPLVSSVPLDPPAVLMRAGGHPVLAAYEDGARRVVDLRFDPARSPMAVRPAFPLLVASSVAWLTSTDRVTWTAGDPVGLSITGITGVTGPDGTSIPHLTTRFGVSVDQTSAAGIYRFASPDGDIPVAVNPAVATESDLSSPVSGDATKSSTAGITPVRSLVNLDVALLVAALVVLAGEWRMRSRGQG
jgi:hypothetical protein